MKRTNLAFTWLAIALVCAVFWGGLVSLVAPLWVVAAVAIVAFIAVLFLGGLCNNAARADERMNLR
jgi:RsiW-degrading membrane proteinase PrsW (M82 family)